MRGGDTTTLPSPRSRSVNRENRKANGSLAALPTGGKRRQINRGGHPRFYNFAKPPPPSVSLGNNVKPLSQEPGAGGRRTLAGSVGGSVALSVAGDSRRPLGDACLLACFLPSFPGYATGITLRAFARRRLGIFAQTLGSKFGTTLIKCHRQPRQPVRPVRPNKRVSYHTGTCGSFGGSA